MNQAPAKIIAFSIIDAGSAANVAAVTLPRPAHLQSSETILVVSSEFNAGRFVIAEQKFTANSMPLTKLLLTFASELLLW